MRLRAMSAVELTHVEAGRVRQLELERDRLCVERDIAQADGDEATATTVQQRIDEVVRLLEYAPPVR